MKLSTISDPLDYVNRAMPLGSEELTTEEVYAVVAYLLTWRHRARDFVLSDHNSRRAARLPNRNA